MPIRKPDPPPLLPPILTPPKPRLTGNGDGSPLSFFRNLLSSPSAGSNSPVSTSLPGSSSSAGGSSVAGNTGRHDPVAPPLPPRSVRMMLVGDGFVSMTPQTISFTRPPPQLDIQGPARGGSGKFPGYGGGVDMQERISSWVVEPVTGIHQILIGSSDIITKIGYLYSKGKITGLQIMKDPHGQGIVLKGTLGDPSLTPYGYAQFIYEPSRKGNPADEVVVLSTNEVQLLRTSDGGGDHRPKEEKFPPAKDFFGKIS